VVEPKTRKQNPNTHSDTDPITIQFQWHMVHIYGSMI